MADFASEPSAGADEPSVMFLPPWDWVEAQPFVRQAPTDEARADGGRCFWLSDAQVSTVGPQQIWFYRTVAEVVDSQGLHDAAQLKVDFDPTFERLVLHHVRVLRDDAVREVDAKKYLSTLRREPDLERACYDGRLTAHLVIPDVRVGDLVDIAYSTVGSPPLFGDRFSGSWALSWGCWVGETRVRLLSRPDQSLLSEAWNLPTDGVERVRDDGLVEREWRALAMDAVSSEPDVASWVRQTAVVRVSTPLRWSDVADTFRGHYESEPLPDDLRIEIEALVADTEDHSRVAVQLLRRVQSELRYQAVSIGDGGFIPRSITYIWGARTGDCKDASRLLVAMLRHAAFDAVPVLVSTDRGWVLHEEAPRLNAFDHCIVRLRVGGETYWLDPTRYPQGGALAVLHQARFGWALPLEPDADLEFMGDDPVRDVFKVEEVFELGPNPASPARLTVTTRYGAWRADNVRRSLGSEAGTLVRGYLEYYGRYFGEVRELEPMKVDDDVEANVLTTVEQYELRRVWTKTPDDGVMEFNPIDDLFATHLTTQPQGRRRWPIDLGLPRRAECTTIVRLPVGVNADRWDRTYGAVGVQVSSTHGPLDEAGRELRLHRSVLVERRFLSAEDAEAFFELRESALRTAGLIVTLGVQNDRFLDLGRPAEYQGKPWGSLVRALIIMALVTYALRLVGKLAESFP